MGNAGTDRRTRLTERQRAVLALIARGRTNAEIAAELGISFETAKSHVAEILLRLNLDTREEAAEWWRREHGLRARLLRLGGSAGLPVKAKTAAVAAGVALVLVLAAFAGVFLFGGGERDLPADPATLAPSPSASATVTPTAAATATASPSPAAVPTPLRTITGLFAEPRETVPDQVVRLPEPVLPFAPPPEGHAVIWDTQDLRTFDLGPGRRPSFSPDGTKAAFIAVGTFTSGPVTIVDLRDGSTRVAGTGMHARFEDDRTLYFGAADEGVLLDLETGVTTPSIQQGRFNPPPEIVGDHFVRVFENLGPDLERGGTASRRLQLVHVPSGAVVYDFVAFAAGLADAATLLVATVPQERLTNIFSVDIAGGAATYIATARISSPNWPFTGSDRFIAWTDGYCDVANDAFVPGFIRVYDRISGELTELDDGLTGSEDRYYNRYFRVTPQGWLQIGPFGGGKLLDPATMTWRAVVPDGELVWSDDYRYAAAGVVGGHGGLC